MPRRNEQQKSDELALTTEQANAELAEKAQERLRVAVLEIQDLPARRMVRFDPTRQELYIAALAAGLPLHKAAAIAGVHPATAAHLRSRDADFDQAVMAAIESGTGAIVDRLQSIALDGDPSSMATVRAGEAVLKTNHRAWAPPSARSRIRMDRKADGSQSISMDASTVFN